MLIYAFASEIIGRVRIGDLRDHLDRFLFRLAGGNPQLAVTEGPANTGESKNAAANWPGDRAGFGLVRRGQDAGRLSRFSSS